jgi:lysozyme
VSVIQSLIRVEEGTEHAAYPDAITRGAPWTIGCGHTGPEVHPGLVWSDAQIDAALDADIAHATDGCRAHLNPWFDDLDEVRQAVLIGMAFQMGIHGLLKFVHFLDAMRNQQWQAAASAMLDSLWAKQTPNRAARAARAIETGVSQWP